MKTYQLDKNFVFTHENPDAENRPYLAVIEPPPDTPKGMIALWVTTLDPVADVNFGDYDTGRWEVVSDNRGRKIYSTETGQEFTDSGYVGIGKLPAGTTLEKPEHPEMRWNGATWVFTEEVKTRLDKEALEQARSQKLLEINAKAQAFINQIAGLDKVPEFEVATWQMQASEAKAWAADKSAQTPTLDKIAVSRGMERISLIEKALQKAIAYEALAATVAGQRQGYEDALKAAIDKDAIDAINPQYKLPEVAK